MTVIKKVLNLDIEFIYPLQKIHFVLNNSQRKMTIEKLRDLLVKNYVLKDTNIEMSKAWKRKKMYYTFLVAIFAFKWTSSPILRSQLFDDITGEYFWASGEAGRLIQFFCALSTIDCLIYQAVINWFEKESWIGFIDESVQLSETNQKKFDVRTKVLFFLTRLTYSLGTPVGAFVIFTLPAYEAYRVKEGNGNGPFYGLFYSLQVIAIYNVAEHWIVTFYSYSSLVYLTSYLLRLRIEQLENERCFYNTQNLIDHLAGLISKTSNLNRMLRWIFGCIYSTCPPMVAVVFYLFNENFVENVFLNTAFLACFLTAAIIIIAIASVPGSIFNQVC